MTASRHRSAWIWLAIAAMTVATLSRAQAGIQSATAYTNPVLQFLAGHPNVGEQATTGGARLHHYRSTVQTKALLLPGAGHSTWQAILPVLFIGLVAPLSLISARFDQFLGRTPAAPALPSRFQRPPPALLF